MLYVVWNVLYEPLYVCMICAMKPLLFKANAFAPMDGKEDEGEGKEGIDDAHELNVSMEATPGGFDLVRWGNIGVNGDVAFFHSRYEACDVKSIIIMVNMIFYMVFLYML